MTDVAFDIKTAKKWKANEESNKAKQKRVEQHKVSGERKEEVEVAGLMCFLCSCLTASSPRKACFPAVRFELFPQMVIM